MPFCNEQKNEFSLALQCSRWTNDTFSMEMFSRMPMYTSDAWIVDDRHRIAYGKCTNERCLLRHRSNLKCPRLFACEQYVMRNNSMHLQLHIHQFLCHISIDGGVEGIHYYFLFWVWRHILQPILSSSIGFSLLQMCFDSWVDCQCLEMSILLMNAKLIQQFAHVSRYMIVMKHEYGWIGQSISRDQELQISQNTEKLDMRANQIYYALQLSFCVPWRSTIANISFLIIHKNVDCACRFRMNKTESCMI